MAKTEEQNSTKRLRTNLLVYLRSGTIWAHPNVSRIFQFEQMNKYFQYIHVSIFLFSP